MAGSSPAARPGPSENFPLPRPPAHAIAVPRPWGMAAPGEGPAMANDAGLVVETAPGAGTRVVVRVPKFAPGVVA